MAYQKFTGTYQSSDHINRVHYYIYEPETDLRAILQIVHDMWQTPAYFHRRVERDTPKSKRWHSFVQQSRTYQPLSRLHLCRRHSIWYESGGIVMALEQCLDLQLILLAVFVIDRKSVV